MLVWRLVGLLAFALGAIGLAVPVWPTTIFWIIAALAFAKSNPAWADWIYNRPRVGPAIRAFVETGQMSRASKIAALIGMGLAAGLAGLLFWQRPWIVAASLGLIAVGAVFVISRKSVG
jgi:uncharacterized protein